MELFVTTNSPYARLIRALLHELCINDRVIVTWPRLALKTARIMRLIHLVACRIWSATMVLASKIPILLENSFVRCVIAICGPFRMATRDGNYAGYTVCVAVISMVSASGCVKSLGPLMRSMRH